MEIEEAPGQLLTAHESDINSIDFGTRDRLATASSDHTVRLWNWSNKNQCYKEDRRSPLTHHSYAVNEVRFSPQGTMLATASTDGTTIVWDLASGTALCCFVQPSRLGVRVCRFSPDASLLVTAGDDDSACIWDIATQSLKRSCRDNEHTVFAAEFTPDGNHLLTTDINGDIRLWAAEASHNKYLVCVEEAHDLGVLCCEFAPWNEDGDSLEQTFTLATAGNDDRVRLWTVRTGLTNQIVSKTKLQGHHSGAVMCVRFSKDGLYLASTGGDKLICIYSVETGKLVRNLNYHGRYVGSCAFSSSGHFFATGSNDRTVAIWRISARPNNPNNSLQFSVDDDEEEMSRLSILADKDEVTMVHSMRAHGSDINDICFTDNNDQLVTCSSDKMVKIWTRDPEAPSHWEQDVKSPLKDHTFPVYSMDYSKDRHLLATSSLDGQTILWDTSTWQKMTVLSTSCRAAVRNCRISVDSQYIVTSGDDDAAHIFSLSSFNHVESLRGHEATVFLACFTANSSHIITGCNDGVLKVWPLSTVVNDGSKSVKALSAVDDAHDLGIVCGACKPKLDNNYCFLVTGGNDSLLKVWKVYVSGSKEGQIDFVQALIGHGSSLMSVKFAQHARLFASTSGDKTLRLWDSNTLLCLRVLEGHDRYVNCCAFNINGDLLATGSNDKSFNVWSLSGSLANEYNPSAASEWSYSDARQWLRHCKLDPTGAGKLSGKDLVEMSDQELIKSAGFSQEGAAKLVDKRKQMLDIDSGGEMPSEFVCPITQDVMKFPVLCSDGFVYEKAAIHEWLISRRKTSPMTNLPMDSTKMVPQDELRNRIKKHLVKL